MAKLINGELEMWSLYLQIKGGLVKMQEVGVNRSGGRWPDDTMEAVGGGRSGRRAVAGQHNGGGRRRQEWQKGGGRWQ